MRNLLHAAGLAAAVIGATALIWLVLAAPGFLGDDASTVPLARGLEARR